MATQGHSTRSFSVFPLVPSFVSSFYELYHILHLFYRHFMFSLSLHLQLPSTNEVTILGVSKKVDAYVILVTRLLAVS